MAERICLLTSYPTNCKDNCFNCDCGGAEATKDAYVSIHNVQRVCAITGGAADTEEGAYIAEVIRNNLETMVVEAQPVRHGKWIWVKNYRDCEGDIYSQYRCSCCDFDVGGIYAVEDLTHFCGNCGVRMCGDTE